MKNNVILFELLKNGRSEKGYKIREVAQCLGVDQALVSKFESGERTPTEEQLQKLSTFLEIPFDRLAVAWLRVKILREVKYFQFAEEALFLVREDVLEYKRKNAYVFSPTLETLLGEIDHLRKRLDTVRHKDNFRIAQALELEYTFESNRIEGNTLTLRETDLIINEGLTVSGKSLREHLEAINHRDAIEYVKELMERNSMLNEREVLSIHNLILRGIYPSDAGRYRNVEVMIKGSAHVPPPFLTLKGRMEEYFDWYISNRKQLHPVVLAAEMHEKLVTIHPFIDGNGRTARLVMNLVLLQHGFVIANIKGDAQSRLNYYEALESVQTGRSTESFRLFIARVEKESLERYLAVVGG